MDIKDFFKNGTCNMQELAAYLNALQHSERVQEINKLNAKLQSILWDSAKGGERLTLDYFVPQNRKVGEPVIHWGKNSLPFFNQFKKPMCRTSDPKKLVGYNDSPAGFIVGNGFFVTRETTAADDDNNGIVIDYTLVPTEKAAHWPEIPASGNNRLGALIYGGNLDFMRRVSDHVSIGRAKKPNTERWMPAWFLLCRED